MYCHLYDGHFTKVSTAVLFISISAIWKSNIDNNIRVNMKQNNVWCRRVKQWKYMPLFNKYQQSDNIFATAVKYTQTNICNNFEHLVRLTLHIQVP